MVNWLQSTVHSQLWLYVDLNLRFSVAVYPLSAIDDKKEDNCKQKIPTPAQGACCSEKMDWKKEIKSWGAILAFFAFLYFSGLLPVIQGGLQSVLLATGLMKPSMEVPDLSDQKFDYRGQFTDFKGNTIDLQAYRGKTVFINLWASWCGPCRAEMPHISDLYDAVKNTPDLEFLMIGLDENKQKCQEFMEGKSWTFPVVHASYGLNESLQSESIPTTLVVNKEGKIVFYQQGMSNFNTAEFKAFLRAQ